MLSGYFFLFFPRRNVFDLLSPQLGFIELKDNPVLWVGLAKVYVGAKAEELCRGGGGLVPRPFTLACFQQLAQHACPLPLSPARRVFVHHCIMTGAQDRHPAKKGRCKNADLDSNPTSGSPPLLSDSSVLCGGMQLSQRFA